MYRGSYHWLSMDNTCRVPMLRFKRIAYSWAWCNRVVDKISSLLISQKIVVDGVCHSTGSQNISYISLRIEVYREYSVSRGDCWDSLLGLRPLSYSNADVFFKKSASVLRGQITYNLEPQRISSKSQIYRKQKLILLLEAKVFFQPWFSLYLSNLPIFQTKNYFPQNREVGKRLPSRDLFICRYPW